MATTLSDLTASAQQLPLCASVSFVLTVLGPPSAHGCYHDAVHVEPGLTQRRRVGLAQTALQHVEKGLTHHLKKSKTNKNTHFFSQLIQIAFSESYYEMLILQQMTGCWLQLPDASSRGWAESPLRSEGHPGGWLLHRSQALPGITCKYIIQRVFKTAHKYKRYTCSGYGGEQNSPWWHVPGTRGWRGSLVWSHSLDCSGKDWGAQGPAQTVYHRQIPHCSIGVYTRHGLPNIHTDTKSICKSYIYKSLRLVSDLAAAVSK